MVIKIKTIGIIIREFKENDIHFMGSRLDIFNAFSKFPINVIGIPINIDFSKIKNIIKFCDGIVLSGGNKFHPNDFLLVEYLYKNEIPTLGICLGMQTMAEYFNNKEEIKIENHYSKKLYAHKIRIDKKSLLYKILKQKEIKVNSRHHSAIPFTNMEASAKSIDNILEAVERSDHSFFLGLQWHPETLNDHNSKKIFQYFIDVIKENK